MKKDVISRVIKIHFNVGNINPSDLTEDKLRELNIVSKNNELDRTMLRVGSLGTNFIFTNRSQDEIKIQPSIIEIKSIDIDRIDLILKGIVNVYNFLSSRHIEYEQDEHLDDDTYPNSIFDSYVKTPGLNLDAIRFKKDNFRITMLSCAPNRIHVKISSSNHSVILLSDLDWKTYIRYDELLSLYEEFFSYEIKLKKEKI